MLGLKYLPVLPQINGEVSTGQRALFVVATIGNTRKGQQVFKQAARLKASTALTLRKEDLRTKRWMVQ